MILIFQNHHFWVQHMNFPGCSVFAPPQKKKQPQQQDAERERKRLQQQELIGLLPRFEGNTP